MGVLGRFGFFSLLATLMVIGPPAIAQTAGSADLSVTSPGPASTPLVGDTFVVDVLISNLGPDSAPDATFWDYFSPELELRSVTSSDPGDTCAQDQPMQGRTEPASPDGGTGGGSVGSGGGGGVTCTLGTMAAGEKTTISMTFERVSGRGAYNSASVSSSAEDPNFENNYTELLIEADTSNPADVGVAMQGPSSPEVGGQFRYKVTVTNAGPSQATGTTVVSPVPDGVTVSGVQADRASDTCRIEEYPDGAYAEVICELGPMASGASVPIWITATRNSAWEIWASAWVQTSNFDPNYDNDYASYTIAADPSVTSDLALTMTGPATTPLVGDTFDLVLRVTNRGPATAGDVWLSDYLPAELGFVSVSPSECTYNDSGGYPMADQPASAEPSPKGDAYYPVYGNGVYCSLGALAVGESKTVTITVTRTGARETWNSAWVSSSNYEPNYDNNYKDLHIGPDKSRPADIAVALTAPATAEVGSNFDFELAVTNNGPSQADGVMVYDYLPYETEFVAVASDDPAASCIFEGYGEPKPMEGGVSSPYGGGQVVCNLGSMASGATTRVTITVTRTSDYEIWNSAWAQTSNYDPDYNNDSASVLVEGRQYEGTCPAGGGSETGTPGDDSIAVGGCDAATGGGSDTVEVQAGSSSGPSSIETGKGNDTIQVNVTAAAAGPRRIEVHGGRGRDTIVLSVAPDADGGTVLLDGGRGDDRIEVDVPPGVTITVIVTGRGGNDTLLAASGTSQSTQPSVGIRMRGGAAADLLQGGRGPDILRAGAGRDRLYGGFGNDELIGGRGADICRGGPGRDSRSSC